MRVPAALAADLILLTDTLDDPAQDVTASLHRLAASARAAIRTYLGLTIVMIMDDRDINFTAMEVRAGRIPVAASLQVLLEPETPWSDREGARAPGALILYASQPGAFVDLAADISWLTGGDLADVLLDRHLTPPDADAPDGVAAIFTINQAIGVLIARGHLPDQARRHLDRRGAATGGDRLTASRDLLGEMNLPP